MCKELWDFFKPEIDEAMENAKKDGKNEGVLFGEVKAYTSMGLSVEEISQKMHLSVAEVEKYR